MDSPATSSGTSSAPAPAATAAVATAAITPARAPTRQSGVAASVRSAVVVRMSVVGDRVVANVTPRVEAGSFRPRTDDGTKPRNSSVVVEGPVEVPAPLPATRHARPLARLRVSPTSKITAGTVAVGDRFRTVAGDGTPLDHRRQPPHRGRPGVRHLQRRQPGRPRGGHRDGHLLGRWPHPGAAAQRERARRDRRRRRRRDLPRRRGQPRAATHRDPCGRRGRHPRRRHGLPHRDPRVVLGRLPARGAERHRHRRAQRERPPRRCTTSTAT